MIPGWIAPQDGQASIWATETLNIKSGYLSSKNLLTLSLNPSLLSTCLILGSKSFHSKGKLKKGNFTDPW